MFLSPPITACRERRRLPPFDDDAVRGAAFLKNNQTSFYKKWTPG
jgi:hypothetical protein